MSRRNVLALVATTLLGCGDSDAGVSDSGAGSVDAPSDAVGPVADGAVPTHSMSMAIGPEGGEITVGDLTVIVPPDALATSEVISISRFETEDPDLLGAVYRIEPDGLELALPAVLSFALPFSIDPREPPPLVARLAPEGFEILEPDASAAADAMVVRALTDHFSDYAVHHSVSGFRVACDEPCPAEFYEFFFQHNVVTCDCTKTCNRYTQRYRAFFACGTSCPPGYRRVYDARNSPFCPTSCMETSGLEVTCVRSCGRYSPSIDSAGMEQCDGDNLNGQSCETLGLAEGDGGLACNAVTCQFDDTGCIGALDAGPSPVCTSDAECDDGNPANGVEVCDPMVGCVAGT